MSVGVGAAEHAGVAAEFFRPVERQIELVGQPERQAGGGFGLVRQRWKEQVLARGENVCRQGDDSAVGDDGAALGFDAQLPAAMVDARDRRFERDFDSHRHGRR